MTQFKQKSLSSLEERKKEKQKGKEEEKRKIVDRDRF